MKKRIITNPETETKTEIDMKDNIATLTNLDFRKIPHLLEIDTQFLTKLNNDRAAKLTYAISITDDVYNYVIFQVSR